jgi:hypothetical protein
METGKMTAPRLLAEAAVTATAHLLGTGRFPKVRHLAETEPDRHAELVCGSLRQVLKSHVPDYARDWKEAVDARMSGSWLAELLKTQAVEAAVEALRIAEEEL